MQNPDTPLNSVGEQHLNGKTACSREGKNLPDPYFGDELQSVHTRHFRVQGIASSCCIASNRPSIARRCSPPWRNAWRNSESDNTPERERVMASNRSSTRDRCKPAIWDRRSRWRGLRAVNSRSLPIVSSKLDRSRWTALANSSSLVIQYARISATESVSAAFSS